MRKRPIIYKYRHLHWCKTDCLILNIEKEKKMTFDFRRSQDLTLKAILNLSLKKVQFIKPPYSILSDGLRWKENIVMVYKLLKRSFSTCSKSFYPSNTQYDHFRQSVILSISLYTSALIKTLCSGREKTLLIYIFFNCCDILMWINNQHFSTAENFHHDTEPF